MTIRTAVGRLLTSSGRIWPSRTLTHHRVRTLGVYGPPEVSGCTKQQFWPWGMTQNEYEDDTADSQCDISLKREAVGES